ncbi:MAG TPA: tRNA epoxyqueuosine(34) reductase QueG [Gammaproteobacteria bacterium]|nr:tRNA epoxyqueuosine(34) reductase QueG [Gammaproteobacteria bacterium]
MSGDSIDYRALAQRIKQWGLELGFGAVGISDTDLSEAERRLQAWLAKGYHGEMAYMQRHGSKRTRPAELVPGTLRIVSVRMDYRPPEPDPAALLEDPSAAFISRYALGRDYHKLMRARLKRLAQRIAAEVGEFGYRVFTDSAPVMEKAIAQKAGLGWIGKHSNLLARDAGSWFFLGELYTDLPLPVDAPVSDHCGQCTACIDACPTGAIVAPYEVDARRCISYLTIELHGPIPEPLRPLMGNRIYGCDDCQLCCPWNRFARDTVEPDFLPRHGLDSATLCELFAWDEATFLKKTEGSAIRRIGHERWLRNIAVALGNSGDPAAREALLARRDHPSPLVREHVAWALARLNPGDG